MGSTKGDRYDVKIATPLGDVPLTVAVETERIEVGSGIRFSATYEFGTTAARSLARQESPPKNRQIGVATRQT